MKDSNRKINSKYIKNIGQDKNSNSKASPVKKNETGIGSPLRLPIHEKEDDEIDSND